MKNSLQIKSFKKIQESITLNDFGYINYLIGPNGCGKSSVLNALAYLVEHKADSLFFRRDTSIDLNFNDERIWLTCDPHNNTPLVKREGVSSLRIIQPFEPVINNENSSALYNPFSYDLKSQSEYEFLNETAELINMPTIRMTRVQLDEWNDEERPHKLFKEGETGVNPKFLSSGLKALNDIRYNILKSIENIHHYLLFNQKVRFIILIEEPENFLHPSLQKEVPRFLNEIIKPFDEKLSVDVNFFVTTHSPFLISNSRFFDDQKIYPMKDACMVDLEGKSLSDSSGYSGSQSLPVVANMLGAEISDLGYPENFCVLEEDSLLQILKPLSDHGVIKKMAFLSASGWGNVESYANVFKEMDKLTTILKCNPLYDKTYLVIVDNVDSNKFSTTERNLITKMRKSIGDRLIMLGKHSLEDYYPNISKELYDGFQEEYAVVAGYSKKGEIKGEYAKRIAALVTTKEHFIRLFDGELNFLLPD